jgi:integrase
VLVGVALFATVCYGVRMILSDYERKDSPWVWIQYADGRGGRKYFKTPVRKDDPDRLRKVAIQLNRIESQLLTENRHDGGRGGDWLWVLPYLTARYAAKPRTRRIYLAQWRSLDLFFTGEGIGSPALLTREHVFAYIEWRQSTVKEKSKRTTKLNTALGELKLLGLLMDEAVSRHLAVENPARKLKIAREETESKPEILDEELRLIFEGLKTEPEWMRKSFELALKTGLRFGDTRLARSQVRWESDDLLIEKPKGGRKREFTIPIYEDVRAMLVEFRMSGQQHLWTAPAKALTGLAWTRFFRRIGLPHLCFHCTRVTFVTRGMRAGIPESVMCKMVNHGSKLINRIYQRWTSDDVRRFAGQVKVPYGDAAKSRSRNKKASRPGAAADRPHR